MKEKMKNRNQINHYHLRRGKTSEQINVGTGQGPLSIKDLKRSRKKTFSNSHAIKRGDGRGKVPAIKEKTKF